MTKGTWWKNCVVSSRKIQTFTKIIEDKRNTRKRM